MAQIHPTPRPFSSRDALTAGASGLFGRSAYHRRAQRDARPRDRGPGLVEGQGKGHRAGGDQDGAGRQAELQAG